MTNKTREPAEEKSLQIVQARVQSWWLAVIANQAEEDHPIYGNKVKAHLDGQTLIITGTVPSGDDRDALQAEAETAALAAGATIRNEVEVEPDETGETGLLQQTLIGLFETDQQAAFARGYLEAHEMADPSRMVAISPEAVPDWRVKLQSALPVEYQEDVARALGEGRSVLIVTVDEISAFRLRQLLEEETQSLETVVLPPEPIKRA